MKCFGVIVLLLIKKNDDIILFDNKKLSHAPTLVFSNSNSISTPKINYSISSKYCKNENKIDNIFWFLRLNGLQNYLFRRSQIASKPSKHFPTEKTYHKVKTKINGITKIYDFNKGDFFTSNYNRLRNSNYLDGEQILKNLNNRYKNKIPEKWIKTVALNCNNNVKAIALIIDDGHSVSLENIASERSSLSYGVFLCTQIIDFYSQLNYYSFDAGISKRYGVYKDKIFLDSFKINLTKTSLMKRLINRFIK